MNNLVREENVVGYYERLYRGNLLFAQDVESGQGLFFLKEAQSPNAQLKYMGGDYLTAFGQIRMTGLGISGEDITPDRWTQGYSAVTGVCDGSEYSALCALKTYQSRLRKRDPARAEKLFPLPEISVSFTSVPGCSQVFSTAFSRWFRSRITRK